MKPMEYKITLLTNGPIPTDALLDPIKAIAGVTSAEVTSYRVKNPPKSQAATAAVPATAAGSLDF